jgi:hypothetical protein
VNEMIIEDIIIRKIHEKLKEYHSLKIIYIIEKNKLIETIML